MYFFSFFGPLLLLRWGQMGVKILNPYFVVMHKVLCLHVYQC